MTHHRDHRRSPAPSTASSSPPPAPTPSTPSHSARRLQRPPPDGVQDQGPLRRLPGTVTIAEDPLALVRRGRDPGPRRSTPGTQTRDEHLRSADFFDAEAHPTITYRSTRVTPAARARWTVDGELTVARRHPLGAARRSPSRVAPRTRGAAPGSASPPAPTLDREDFGLTWNQALETGGVLVGKQVQIDIEAEAVQE